MPEVKIYKSPFKAIRLLTIMSPLLIIGLYGLSARVSPVPAKACWVCLFIFGLVLLFALYTLFDRRPQFVLSEKGILARAVYGGIIDWNIIKNIYLKGTDKGKFIFFVISNENIAPIRATIKAGRLFEAKAGYKGLKIPLNTIKIDEGHFMDFMLTMTKMDEAGRIEALKKLTSRSFR